MMVCVHICIDSRHFWTTLQGFYVKIIFFYFNQPNKEFLQKWVFIFFSRSQLLSHITWNLFFLLLWPCFMIKIEKFDLTVIVVVRSCRARAWLGFERWKTTKSLYNDGGKKSFSGPGSLLYYHRQRFKVHQLVNIAITRSKLTLLLTNYISR